MRSLKSLRAPATTCGLALAACLGWGPTAAHAQSDHLTLYGIVDGWAGVQKTKAGAATGTVGMVESGGAQASRWGIKGTEDLGGGLKLNFVLEQGIAIDTGGISTVSASNGGFNRNSFVRLSGPFGELKLGRMLTAYDALRGPINHLYDSSGFASTGQTWSASTTAGNGLPPVSGSDYLARTNNTIQYGTPEYRDFSAAVSVGMGEGGVTATAAPRTVTGNVIYDDDTTRVGYSFQREFYTTGENRYHLVSGKHRFKAFTVVASLQRQTDHRVTGGQTANEYQVGVDVPFGQATVALGYASSLNHDAQDRKVIDASGISAMVTYDLSKRTRLYTAVRQLEVKRGDGSVSSDVLRWGVGVTHRF